jgi:hypothetical protein
MEKVQACECGAPMTQGRAGTNLLSRFDHGLELIRLKHLAYDFGTTHKLTRDIQLRDGWPANPNNKAKIHLDTDTVACSFANSASR